MYLIIRLNDKDTYNSECFGILRNESGRDYFVVLDSDYTNLILIEPNFRYYLPDEGDCVSLCTKFFVLNYSKPNWIINGSNLGLDFIVNNEEVIAALFKGEKISVDIVNRAVDIHKKFKVQEWYEINSEEDADSLTGIAKNFHYSYLVNIELESDSTIFTFDTPWEYLVKLKCDSKNLVHNLRLEDKTIWFEGEVIYGDNKIALVTDEVVLGEEKGSIECSKMSWQLIPQSVRGNVWEQVKEYLVKKDDEIIEESK